MKPRTRLTKELIQEAQRLSAEFRTEKEIYTLLGIAESTFYKWKSNTTNPMCLKFVEALKKGREEYLQNLEQECLANIRAAKEWQSDAWLLERCLPDKYAKVDRLQATLDGNLNSEINIEVIGDEQ